MYQFNSICFFFRKSPKSPVSEKERAGKKPRIWELGGTNKDLGSLERTTDKPEDMKSHFTPDTEVSNSFFAKTPL